MKRIFITTIICLLIATELHAQSTSPLRRPISSSSPTWLIHIDVWVQADPMKVIDLIPEDVRPFVIFNLSLSVSDIGTGPYGINATPTSIIETWLRACAERGVWAVIQPASGYKCQLPYTHTANDDYERYYKEYPNFLGYNFCEQCWGFSSDANKQERVQLFCDLIKLGAKYGGFLFVSHAQTMNTPNFNALALLKRYPEKEFATLSKQYKDNYISLEKYTTSRGFYDVESTTLGTFLSGYCGNYGMRFDNCGWTMLAGRDTIPYPESVGAMMIAEHFLLTGTTVQDGPELTTQYAIIKDGTQTTSDGYSSKKFKMHDSFINHNLDLFRKQLDGSFRIPTKDEVIARTKVAFVNDATTGNDLNKFASEPSLFTGLYAIDGEHSDNHIWTKSTGRYPTIPSIYKQGTYETGRFQKVVKKSGYLSTWPTIAAKVSDLNTIFPQEYTGTIYASRLKNTWMTYNPYMGRRINDSIYELVNSPATGIIPFKYNTCDSMELTHSNYGYAVFNEYSDKLDVYVNNFCSTQSSSDVPLVRDTKIRIFGSTQKPTYSYKYRVLDGTGNSTLKTEGLTIADFEANNVGDTYPMTNSLNGQSEVTMDPVNVSGKVLHIFGPANQTFPKINISLPSGRKLGDFKTLKLDFNGGSTTGLYGQGMRMAINDRPLTSFGSAQSFGCPNGSWGRGLIALSIANLNLSDTEKELTTFTVTIGSATGAGNYYIDNIILEREYIYSPIVETWANGIYTLTISHNAPLDISINCLGTATDRLTDYPSNQSIVKPVAPSVYNGLRQHEFEDFEYKNIEKINASNKTEELQNYTGMGYSVFGSNVNASMRKKINVASEGTYLLKTRYSAPTDNVGTINLLVNGVQTTTLVFDKTSTPDDWKYLETTIHLESGDNTLEYKSMGASNTLYLDHVVLENRNLTAIPEYNKDPETQRVLSETYYSVLGQRLNPKAINMKGIYLVKQVMSDGSVRTKKVLATTYK